MLGKLVTVVMQVSRQLCTEAGTRVIVKIKSIDFYNDFCG